ncbi:hypothetical protein HMPREF9711_01332 [Myroides odoratimimus CCUG 3837]|uniref:hypothetical protein n=1 Tax=Myroides odoratimimus TaxID=76832 RepID=UPI000280AA3D|nr:hypothetical protein [Myroides odoratimimus]EKB05370.1 hypothetical protein HMPREF9711_01332 [Myroides odoratimimus CCUG 3837]
MTTLSTDQIEEIEEFLITQYNIKYQDTREEVLDHIACEIEELMSEGFGYEIAFKKTFNKWHKDLSPHLWIRYNNIPRFIAKQWFWSDFLSFAVIITLGISIPYLFKNSISQYNLADVLVSTLSLLGVLLGGFVYLNNYKNKGYRISLLKREALSYGGICLFYYILFLSGDVTYKILPLPLLATFTQIYYFREALKVKHNPSRV